MTTDNIKIDTSKPALVTGATGYVAGVIIQQLLEKGVTVHATVRDPSKTSRLEYLIEAANKSPGSIKFFKGDLLDTGSFEEAMKGCSTVFHTASPFTLSVSDPRKDLIEPAVKGTENVLETCNKTPSVKRVVVTSSVVAIFTDASEHDPKRPMTEDTWNRTSSISYQPYSLSKTLAEQKAWVIAGSQTQWRLCTINPGFVQGPGLTIHPSSESVSFCKSLGSNDPTMSSGLPPVGFGVVDVRDVAQAHLAAAYADNAKGRYILCGHNTSIAAMAAAIYKKYGKEYPIVNNVVPSFLKPLVWLLAPLLGVERQFIWNNFGYKTNLDNSKSKKELGIKYRSLEETMQDGYQQLIDNNMVPTRKDGKKSKSKAV